MKGTRERLTASHDRVGAVGLGFPTMFKRILVATDFSEAAGDALVRAGALANRDGAALAVLHVLPNLQPINMLFPQAAGAGMADYVDLERRALDALSRVARELTSVPDDRLEVLLETGIDYACIASRAEAWGADLVVVGSHGTTAMRRALLGGVAEKVVRFAHSPVLVHRSRAGAGPVVVATDLSDPSLPAIRAGAEEARRRSAPLHVLHVIDVVPTYATQALGAPFGITTLAVDEGTVQEMVTGASRVLEDAMASAGAEGRGEVVRGPAAATVVRRTEELESQLLVLATHGHTGLARAMIGSTAESIVRHAHCPVLVARFPKT